MTVDAWTGVDCIMTFEKEGADAVYNYQGKILKYSRSGGKRSTEAYTCFANTNITFNKSREKFEVSMDILTNDTSFDHIFMGGAGATSSTTEMNSAGDNSRWRIILWLCPYSNHKVSGSVRVPPKSGEIYRITHCDCSSVSFDKDFEADDVMKGTITFEISATDSDGYANIFEQYTSQQGTTALAVYNTTSHKGGLTWATTTPAWTGSYRT